MVDGECVEACGGFEGCTSYFDGCNGCSCTDNGLVLCTKIACTIEQITKPYCTACLDDYFLRDGACIAKVECETNRDCKGNFKCRIDPDCESDESDADYALDRVCLKVRPQQPCVTDDDCSGDGLCRTVNSGNSVCVVFQA